MRNIFRRLSRTPDSGSVSALRSDVSKTFRTQQPSHETPIFIEIFRSCQDHEGAGACLSDASCARRPILRFIVCEAIGDEVAYWPVPGAHQCDLASFEVCYSISVSRGVL